MMGLLESIYIIAFNIMDERLKKYIEDKIVILNSKQFCIIHKEIATYLQTSRIVVSRLLKKMEFNTL